MNFYNEVKGFENSNRKVIATVVNSGKIGQKAIWVDGELKYATDYSIPWLDDDKIDKLSNNMQIVNHDSYQFFIEKWMNKKQIIICGAGHISIPIIQMGKMLGFHVTVIDDRPLFANNARKTGADVVICEPFADALDKITGDENSFFVIVTRGHRYDKKCLEKIILKENTYIGMIGSKKRVKTVFESLREFGVEDDKLKKIYTPIGLDINAETPEEIAVAIMAEIIQVKNLSKGASGFQKEIFEEIVNNEHKNIRKALITIISKKGSAPREVGTKMLVFEDGTTLGTIGGGCVEASTLNNALHCIKTQKAEIIENDMTGQDAEEEGMVCGGIIKMLIEPI